MSVFRSIVFSAVLAGVVAGAATTAVQMFGTVKLIQQAEVYEKKAEARRLLQRQHLRQQLPATIMAVISTPPLPTTMAARGSLRKVSSAMRSPLEPMY